MFMLVGTVATLTLLSAGYAVYGGTQHR